VEKRNDEHVDRRSMLKGVGLAGKATSGWNDLSSDQLDEVGDVPAAINYRAILAPVLEAHTPGVDLSAVFPGHTFGTPTALALATLARGLRNLLLLRTLRQSQPTRAANMQQETACRSSASAPSG
jgi:hypothetical protein